MATRVDHGGRRRQAAQPRDRARDQAPPDDPGLDQHGRHQDQPEEGRHGAGRQLGHRPHFHHDVPPTSMVRVIGTPSRSTLSISTIRIGAEAGAEDAAAAAENAGAADDDGGDDDQLVALPVLAVGALVLRHVHQAGDGRAERRENEGADAHLVRC